MGCLTGVYPVEIPGEKCIATQTKLSAYLDLDLLKGSA
jgi:hypothetical protein